MSVVLGIDTALGHTSIVLCRGAALLAQRSEPDREQQASCLLQWVEDVLAAADMSYADLDAVSVAIGPGGFTGIRIGLAAARGIGLAAHKPVVGFSTLQLMALAASETNAAIVAVLPAGRGMVFAQEFVGLQAQGEVRMEELSRHCEEYHDEAIQNQVAKTGLLRYARNDVKIITTIPTLSHAIQYDITRNAVGLCHLAQNKSAESHAPAPLYIRPPDAKLPTKAAY